MESSTKIGLAVGGVVTLLVVSAVALLATSSDAQAAPPQAQPPVVPNATGNDLWRDGYGYFPLKNGYMGTFYVAGSLGVLGWIGDDVLALDAMGNQGSIRRIESTNDEIVLSTPPGVRMDHMGRVGIAITGAGNTRLTIAWDYQGVPYTSIIDVVANTR